MVRFTVEHRYDAAPERVWSVLADYGNIADWNSGVDASGIVAGPEQGVDAVRECRLANGMTVKERITAWTEGHGFTIRFDEMPAPFDAEATFHLAPDGDGSHLRIDYAYAGRGLGKLVAPFMKPMFRGAMVNLGNDLRAAVEADA